MRSTAESVRALFAKAVRGIIPTIRYGAVARAAGGVGVEALETRLLFGFFGLTNLDEIPVPGSPSVPCPGYGPPPAQASASASMSPAYITTDDPIRAFDGMPVIASSDLSSNADGFPLNHARSWTGLNNSSLNGNGWSDSDLPYLVVGGGIDGASTPGDTPWTNADAPAGGIPDDRISLVQGGTAAYTFAIPTSGPYSTYSPWGAQGGMQLDLISNVSPPVMRFTDAYGNITDFYDVYRDGSGRPVPHSLGVDQSQLYRRFKDYIPAGGEATATASYDSNGYPQAVTRTDSLTGETEQLAFSYSTVTNDLVTAAGDTPPELATSVTLQREVSGSWQPVERGLYTYYTGRISNGSGGYVNDPNGRLGDLQLAQIQNASISGGSTTWTTVGSSYYRYVKLTGESDNITSQGPTNNAATTGGPDPLSPALAAPYTPSSSDSFVFSGLKTVVEGAAFARMAAAVPDYLTASDATIQPYVNHYFQYERWADHVGVDGNTYFGATAPNDNSNYWWRVGYRLGTRYRVTEDIAQGAGCSCAGGSGQGTFKFEYAGNNSNAGANSDGIGYGVLDFNTWRMKTTEFLPSDDSDWGTHDRQVTWTNELGQPLLNDLVHVDSTDSSITGMSYSYSSGVATITVTDPNHPFNTGDTVAISGVLPELYDGVFSVTRIDANTFSFVLPATYYHTDSNGPEIPPPYVDETYTNLDGSTGTVPAGSAVKVLSQTLTADRYDSQGRPIEEAQPSAMTGYDDSQDDPSDQVVSGSLVTDGWLSANSGLIQTSTYYNAGWQFSGSAGIASNGSSISGTIAATDGTQAAFLTANGSMIQTVANWPAGTYTLSFSAAQSSGSSQSFQILLDGTNQLSSLGTTTFQPTGSGYNSYTTDSFTIDAGTHTLQFVGLGSGSVLIDSASLAGTGAPVLGDGGFESIPLASGTVEYDPLEATATSISAGNVSGFLESTAIQQGTGGTSVPQEQLDYISHSDSNGFVVYVQAHDTVYRNTDGTGAETTGYSYAWFPGTNQVASRVTTPPVISSTQNGSGSAQPFTDVFNRLGQEIDNIDGGGHVTQTSYDASTGAVTQSVVDAAPYEANVLQDAPLAYYRLGESSGTTAADATDNGNTGTYTGGYTLGQTGALSGDSDTAASFNGSTGYVSLGDPAPMQISTGSATLEAWVNVTATPAGNAGIISRSTVSGTVQDVLALEVSPTGKVRGEVYDGTHDPSVDSPTPIVGTGWHHVAFVRDTNSHLLRLYVDGTQVATYTDSTGDLNGGGSQAWSIGRRTDSSGLYVTGTIDEAAIYGTALSAAQIQRHYNAGVGNGVTPLKLTTTYQVDALGRETEETDPNSNQTYTVYDDANHQTMVFPGWNASTHTTTGPVTVSGEYWPVSGAPSGQQTVYDQTLTTTATPTWDSTTNDPTGIGALTASNIQSLSRQLTNNGGQVIESDAYFSLAGVTYSAATAQLGTSSNDSSTGNYYATLMHYDDRGREDLTTAPTGTITYTGHDAQGRVYTIWVGTNATPGPNDDDWSPTNQGSGSNMVDVQDNFFDTQNAPAVPTLGQTAGGTSTAGAYYVKVTYLTSSGETAASVEGRYSVNANSVLTVALSGTAPSGVTGYNVYVGTASGSELLQSSSPISVTSTWTEPTSGLVTGTAKPPTGGIGDGDLTQSVQHTGANGDRWTETTFDWRDRPVNVKEGVQANEDTATQRAITHNTFDNLGELTEQDTYAGNTVQLQSLGSTSGVPNAPSSGLMAKETSAYDDRERVYQMNVYSVDPSTGTVGNPLTSNTYYDSRGNVVATSDPSGLWNKSVIDGAGRVTSQYSTDGGAVNAAGTLGSYSQATSISSDVVLSETDTTYDGDSNPIFVVSKDRFHNDATTATGALGSPTSGVGARDSYTANYFDSIKRETDSVNVGTNGGSAYTRPSTVPTGSSTVLVTHNDFGAAGWLADTIDPRGIKTGYFDDLMGRTIKTIGAWDGTQQATPTASANQTTTYTLDGDGHTLSQTAVMPSGQPSQTTGYLYSIGSAGNLYSNDLLSKVEYPDPTTGDASSSSSNDQSYTYDNLGDTTTFTDQNGTTHTYTQNVLGQLTLDAITALGSGVDGTVRALGYNYTTLGEPYQSTEYSSANGTGVLNQVQDVYNGLGQLATQYQELSGAVNASTSLKVQYGYTDPTTGSRLYTMTYPNGRILHFGYNNSTVDNAIGRVDFQADDNGSGGVGSHLADYSYLGLSTIVDQADANGVSLSMIQQTGDTLASSDGGDQYTGLDRFDRTIDQNWVNTSTGVSTDRFQYGFDQDGNVLYKNNLVSSANSELYHANGSSNGYDDLNQLQAFARGTLNSTHDTISTSTASQSWSLDPLGNWSSVTDSATNSSTPQTRTTNAQNEITGITGNSLSGSGTASTPTYDYNGNMLTDDRGDHYTYNAWNQLVTVKDHTNTTTLAAYTNNALGERVTETHGSTTTSLYYSDNWQVLEEKNGATTTKQNVWGLGFVDNLLLRDDNSVSGSLGISGSGLGERLFVQHDANYNVTALVSSTGTVLQRFIYTPYGQQTVLSASWTATSDGYNWSYYFQGGRLDPATGLINFRNRDLAPWLGTWFQKDPSGYPDGPNQYAAFRSDPVASADPLGLSTRISNDSAGARRAIALGAEANDLRRELAGLARAMYDESTWLNEWHPLTSKCEIAAHQKALEQERERSQWVRDRLQHVRDSYNDLLAKGAIPGQVSVEVVGQDVYDFGGAGLQGAMDAARGVGFVPNDALQSAPEGLLAGLPLAGAVSALEGLGAAAMDGLAGAAGTTENAVQDTVLGYRAVSQAEWDQIAQDGEFYSPPNASTPTGNAGKWFYGDQTSAEQFADTMSQTEGAPYGVVQAQLPRSSITFTQPGIDSGYGVTNGTGLFSEYPGLAGVPITPITPP